MVAVIPPVGITGHAAWSPDGSHIALSRFGRAPGDRAGGSDILVVPESGGEAMPVAQHDADGALLGAPAWTPDGSGLFFDHLPPNGIAADTRVMYAALGQSPRVIAEGGWPTVSPDGRYLVYVRAAGSNGFLDELVIMAIDGTGSRVLVPAEQFVQIDSPRFSPDGSEIAFVGSLTRGEARAPTLGGSDLFAKSVMAHGPPGDVWLMSAYGGYPRRMTAFEEDEPTLAWSPNGIWIIMMAGGGLYLVTHDGSEPPRRLGTGGFGGIDWR
jgi:Tol biopolymer transport system component